MITQATWEKVLDGATFDDLCGQPDLIRDVDGIEVGLWKRFDDAIIDAQRVNGRWRYYRLWLTPLQVELALKLYVPWREPRFQLPRASRHLLVELKHGYRMEAKFDIGKNEFLDAAGAAVLQNVVKWLYLEDLP